ncbi:Uncharacterized protein LW94_7676 [Fusarium fujikuroi]|nr:Uncharacterized protein LW93_7580 [Fusarium fujikuroi]KLO99902.1 Uncharacterized protein LW94_7676 [Fusarium fujikuroi]KLP09924.1 Uncharacterized protein Y057_6415 [Fusarium fujikuroi]
MRTPEAPWQSKTTTTRREEAKIHRSAPSAKQLASLYIAGIIGEPSITRRKALVEGIQRIGQGDTLARLNYYIWRQQRGSRN